MKAFVPNPLIKVLTLGMSVLLACLPLFAQGSNGSDSGSGSKEVPLQIIVVSSAAEAKDIHDRLDRGDNFAVLAKERSSDPTADAGGYMGTMDPAMLRAELKNALSGVAPGHITPVAQIPEGFAILKVLSPDQVMAMEKSAQARQTAVSAVSAPGAIKYTPNVSGIGEVESVFFNFHKPPGWTQDLQQTCQTRKDTMANATKKMEDLLDPANAAALANQAPLDVTQEYYSLGELYAYPGEMDKAIQQYLKGYQLALAQVPAVVPQFELELGIAYLHKAEMDNDIYTHPEEHESYPLDKAFAKKEDSRLAIQYLEKFLSKISDDLTAKWLLNYAYMTVGEYPASVPKQWLVPPSVFQSKEDAPHFVDVAEQAGLKLMSMAGGVIVDDFENNGRLDVVTSSMYTCAPMHYFHNNGDGTFTDRTQQAGLVDQFGGLNMIQTDYDNDGCLDILVLRGGWEIPMRKSLLRGHCDGTFTDVTREAGLAEPATATQTAVWTDINNDGLLDLFVGNENGPAQLFLNKGDGTFVDIAHSAGVDKVTFAKSVVSADYDNDGWPDLYVGNFAGDNFLYHNNHNNTFTEVAQPAGVLGPWITFAAWFFDYDNDGWPDLLVNSYFTSTDESVRSLLGLPHNAMSMKLYHNQHDGTFKDVTTEAGLDRVLMPMGANFGDFDNDGFLDMYIGSGNPNYASLIPHLLLRNHDGKYFVDVTAASGTGEYHKGHGVAFADLARNGREDILTVIGGAVLGDAHAFRLFENPGNGNDWINLKLVGVKSNRAAIGARIKVTVENEGTPARSIYRTVGSGGSFGASPFEQHIGLGKSARITNIEIWWPASSTRQEFTNVEKDQFLEVKEFATAYTKLDRKPVRLGGASREASSGASGTAAGK